MRKLLSRFLPIIAGLVALATTMGPTLAASWTETFDGTPASPTHYYPVTGNVPWDVVLKGYDPGENTLTVSGSVETRGSNIGEHGTGCEAPTTGTSFNNDNSTTHLMTDQLDMMFQCNGHLMLSTGLSGYGAVYASPPASMDFSGGEALLTWDMSTKHTSSREWFSMVLSPFNQYEPLAYISVIEHIPADNIHIEYGDGPASIQVHQYHSGDKYDVAGDSSTTIDSILAGYGLSESSQRRDHWKVGLSSTHLRVCFTPDAVGATETCLYDHDLPFSLASGTWSNNAVTQFTAEEYNAEKACIDTQSPPPSNPLDSNNLDHTAYGDATCPPNTWHIDNVSINPAQTFTVILPTGTFPVSFSGNGPHTINFPQAAPSGSYFEATWYGYRNCSWCTGVSAAQLRTSTDGGSTWSSWANVSYLDNTAGDDLGNQILTSVPTGTNAIQFQGSSSWFSPSSLNFIALRSATFVNPGTPTPTPTATNTPTPTATPNPTNTPTPTPTPGGPAFTRHSATSESAVSNTATTALTTSASGDMLVLALPLGDATTTISSISDSGGATFTLKASEVGNGLSTYIYAATGVSSGTHTVTTTFSGSVGHQAAMIDYSSTTTISDDGSGTGSTGSSTAPTSGAYTTTGSNDLLVAVQRYGASQTPYAVAGSGWNQDDGSQSRSIVEDRINQPAGTYTGEAGISTSTSWNAVLFAWKD